MQKQMLWKEVSGREPRWGRWTFNFELPLLTFMSRFSTVLLLIIFTEIMPKESVTSLKQQNQDLKDKVDALSKEITQLKEKVRVDSAITFGAEAAATSGNSNNNASNDETVSRSLQYLSDEYDDLSASNSGVVDQLKALSRRLNKLSAEVTRVGNATDEVEEYCQRKAVRPQLKQVPCALNYSRRWGQKCFCRTLTLLITSPRGSKMSLPNRSSVNL